MAEMVLLNIEDKLKVEVGFHDCCGSPGVVLGKNRW